MPAQLSPMGGDESSLSMTYSLILTAARRGDDEQRFRRRDQPGFWPFTATPPGPKAQNPGSPSNAIPASNCAAETPPEPTMRSRTCSTLSRKNSAIGEPPFKIAKSPSACTSVSPCFATMAGSARPAKSLPCRGNDVGQSNYEVDVKL